MGDINFHGDIEQIEARIETLAEAIERCRKIAGGAKIAIAAGAIWFALILFRIVPFEPAAFVAALTALLGGVVLLGSNKTTWTQTVENLHAAEATRAQLIGSIELRVVGEETPTIH